ncbi:MAG: ATP-grasp fold amidoligase family protein [Treponema sp.]|nr:ATP-grasp fold amidoligase family protein [Treponema sp.]
MEKTEENMNYKKIIKSRAFRIKVMQFLSFVPDSWVLKLQYRIKTGRKLNLKNPQRYSEKIQWYKLNYRNELMPKCVDKWEVRKFVEECGLASILNEVIGVYESPDDIDFGKLPEQFVLKDTLGGGGNSVIICKNKASLDMISAKQQMQQWVKPIRGKHPGREWVYDNAPHRIIIEKYIESEENKGGLIDYKFLCFNGKCEFVYVIANRKLGCEAELGIFSPEFEKLPYERCDEHFLNRVIPKPANWSELLRTAEKLSGAFPHARIDLYNQSEKILFGEITFFDGSGYVMFDPDEFDYLIGDKFILPQRNSKK